MYSAIASNKRRTIMLISVFLLLMAGVAGLASYAYQSWAVGGIILISAVIYVTIQYYFASKQMLAFSGAKQIQKSDNVRLWRIVENLSIASGLPMPAVYIVNDPAPNAFATGRDPNHAAVAATTGLLELLDDAELEGVMAHELGHVKNYDIRLSMIVFGLTAFLAILADIGLRMLFAGGNNRNNASHPIVLLIALGFVILVPIISAVTNAAISRQREYLADATGAELTRYPEGLARALGKISGVGLPVQRIHSNTAHMWLDDPIKKKGFMQRLFSTHPETHDRIRRLSSIGESF